METQKSQQTQDEYFKALGAFVHAYAMLEIAIQVALWEFSKTPVEIAKIIFDGLRIRDVISKIKRIRAVSAKPSDSILDRELEKIFLQIGELTGARDLILHRGALPLNQGDAEFHATNWLHVQNRDQEKGLKVTLKSLTDMTSDTDRCVILLVNIVDARRANRAFDPSTFPVELTGPWRYKSSELAIHPKQHRDKTPKQKHQPKSSRG